MGNPNLYIEKLLIYGVEKKLIEESDIIPVRNTLLSRFSLEYREIDRPECEDDIDIILKPLLDYGFETGLIKENSTTYRDILDSEIMGYLMPRQSEVINKFSESVRCRGINSALREYYDMSRASNYIREGRIKRNRSWKTLTEYGELKLTINLSKPEKNPKEIAAAKALPQSNYPKCFLCSENVGYHGRVNHPGRHNHRVIPMTLGGEKWNLQYSPYLYYNEHSIIFCDEHRPMVITRESFKRLLDFVNLIPEYFIGSNADLPIVGGSILSHDHYQSGRYDFPMDSAREILHFYSDRYKDIEISILKWPLSVVRLKGTNCDELTDLAFNIFRKWQCYWAPESDILSKTEDTLHNTVTPIARFRNEKFELDLVLRNNRTTEERPYGIFHPGEELHHIKKENIGLIEVMGLAILPGRLDKEFGYIKKLLTGDISMDNFVGIEECKKHQPWIDTLIKSINIPIRAEDADKIVEDEVGQKYKMVLEDAGVFKQTEKGITAFKNFMLNSGFILDIK